MLREIPCLDEMIHINEAVVLGLAFHSPPLHHHSCTVYYHINPSFTQIALLTMAVAPALPHDDVTQSQTATLLLTSALFSNVGTLRSRL